jgi:hypothetical protein
VCVRVRVRVFHRSFVFVCGQATPVVSGSASGGPGVPAAAVCVFLFACVREWGWIVRFVGGSQLVCACVCGRPSVRLACEGGPASVACVVSVPFTALPVRLIDQLFAMFIFDVFC